MRLKAGVANRDGQQKLLIRNNFNIGQFFLRYRSNRMKSYILIQKGKQMTKYTVEEIKQAIKSYYEEKSFRNLVNDDIYKNMNL